MSPTLHLFDDPAAFQARAATALLQHEAENNILISFVERLRREPPAPGAPPAFLAAAEDNGAVIAAAVLLPPDRPLFLSHGWHDAALDLLARQLYARGAALVGVNGARPLSGRFAQSWQALSGQQAALFMEQRIYQLEQVRPVNGVPGAMRPAAAADRALLIAWFAAFDREAAGEESSPQVVAARVDARLDSDHSGLVLWEDSGQVVAMAGYSGPTPNGIRVNAVYTPPEFRRRGYASACVAALSQRLLDEGRRFCFLYTDLGNPTSNSIYQKMGYEPVCEVDYFKFRS